MPGRRSRGRPSHLADLVFGLADKAPDLLSKRRALLEQT